MTYLEVVFRYGAAPGENALRAIDGMREVYGVRRVEFNDRERTVRVEFDASRLKAETVARLLRQAGVDARERLDLNARGAQENLWPKSFLERPVARHFVWYSY
jgi:selenocysteine lyase/cysteine desulfurase